MKQALKDKIANCWVGIIIIGGTAFFLIKCAESGYLFHLLVIIVFIVLTRWSINQLFK
jgi:hypothetical protein